METTMGIGRALRVERERKRLSLETIARATMVRKEYLEAIDDDRLNELPSGAYAKGFIRAYANYLSLDPVPFVRTYERQFEGSSGPELSALGMEPVRVPRAVEPRAWRLAFGAAVAVLMILGLIGALGSGEGSEDAAPPLEVALTSSSPEDIVAEAESETAEVVGVAVRVEAVGGRVWVGAHADGEQIFEGFIEEADRQSFRGKESVYLVIGSARNVKVFSNGLPLGTPVEDTYRGTFTPKTKDMPPAQAQ
jgi:hypothetical protein